MPPAAPRGTRLAPLLQYRNRAVTGEDWAGGGRRGAAHLPHAGEGGQGSPQQVPSQEAVSE
jgi:hypothetical protein